MGGVPASCRYSPIWLANLRASASVNASQTMQLALTCFADGVQGRIACLTVGFVVLDCCCLLRQGKTAVGSTPSTQHTLAADCLSFTAMSISR